MCTIPYQISKCQLELFEYLVPISQFRRRSHSISTGFDGCKDRKQTETRLESDENILEMYPEIDDYSEMQVTFESDSRLLTFSKRMCLKFAPKFIFRRF